MAKIAAENIRKRSGREFLASEEFMRKATAAINRRMAQVGSRYSASLTKTTPLRPPHFILAAGCPAASDNGAPQLSVGVPR
jgi:hypothetical protein